MRVYPGFRLGDAATTRSVLVRHLVCACTGLPRKDDDWIFNTPRGTPASTTFDQLAKTQPTSGFGEVYQYNNLLAAAAGYVGAGIVYPGVESGPRLSAPAGAATIAALAAAYVSPELGRLTVERHGVRTRFGFVAWSSKVASRLNDDGTSTIRTIDPGEDGFDFVVGKSGASRTLTIRDGQHAYVFTEAN